MSNVDRRLQYKLDPDAPWTPAAPQELRVDIDSLDEFASQLNKDTTELLMPGAQAFRGELSYAPLFGVGTPSNEVDRARQVYDEAARRNLELGKQYVMAAEILVDAAKLIADRYRDAEALSEAQLRDVEGLLGKATSDALAVQAAATQHDNALQDQLERNRLRGFGGTSVA